MLAWMRARFPPAPGRTAVSGRSAADRAHPAQASNALEVEHLSVGFGDTAVLRDLSFSVPVGGSLAIIGPSGAGKTVLLKALIGAVPHDGVVRWAAGTAIGYVPQKLDIERDLPLSGNDLLRAKAAVSKGPVADAARAAALVNLAPEVLAQPVGTLSGGQFQRLLLGFALVGRPTVLMFDEPTAGVDEPGEEGLYAMIRRLQEQERLTLLLVSHELSLVYRYATTVLCLRRGRPPFMGPPLEILTPQRLEELYGAPLGFHLHGDHSD
jgi:zinc transport system ATP-binding protein